MYRLYNGINATELEPSEFSVGQNYPNPFKNKTVIKYCVAYKTKVQIIVYNSEGKLIEKLVDEEKKPGTYEIEFNTSIDLFGKSRYLSNGDYFYQMIAGDYSSEKKWFCINNQFGRFNMKTSIHIMFFFLLVTQIGFAQWYQQNSGTTHNLNKVQFVDANNGWAVGDSGTILCTSNAGTTWVLQNSGTDHSLLELDFKDVNTGWVVGGSGNLWEQDSATVLKTTDGGLNWIRQLNINVIGSFFDVCFIDDNKGNVVGGCLDSTFTVQAIICRTDDGGLSWSNHLFNGNPFGCIVFADENIGWSVRWTGNIGGYYSTISKTEDGGENWQDQLGTGGWGRVSCFDSSFVIAVGPGDWMNPGGIYRTSNGGTNWIQVYVYGYVGRDVSISSANVVTVVSYGDVLRSMDSGNTWSIQSNVSTQWLDGVFFIDDYTGWVVGENGTILHTTNGGVSFVEEEQIDGVTTEYKLSNNFPNPFNPSTKIKYSVTQSSNIELKVFDVLGNEIETLVNEEKQTGTYEVTWYAENLPSGIYFYQLKADKYIDTKKMILLK